MNARHVLCSALAALTSHLPPCSLGHEALTLSAFRGQTLVLGFAQRWQEARPETLRRIRAELRGLGAALFLVSPREIYAFRADDEVETQLVVTESDSAALEQLLRAHRVEPAALRSGATTLVIVDGTGAKRWSQTSSSLEKPLDSLLDALSLAAARLQTSRVSTSGLSRRELLVASLAAAFTLLLASGCRQPTEQRQERPAAAPAGHERKVVLRVNGKTHTLHIEPRVSLLDALRERLGLTGSKKGCDHGQCGACTVLVAGQRMNSCLLLAVMVENVELTTIEGLAEGETLHPMQTAFIAEDGLQCGYCTPGQIVSAVALLKENRAHTDAEIREQMSGNICRCGAYPNIVRAIQRVRAGSPT
jgi:xanthine dehydrogenase YagT iron-sulfur-binding subunit